MTVSRTLWTMAAGVLALREEPLAPLADGHLRCKALYSAVSRGTESLVFHGRVPPSEWQRMRAPFQRGAFPFPVAYGYQMVAEVIAGPMPSGTTIFALHPHQDLFDIPGAAAQALPPGLPPRRAVLAANMETALNILWDSGAGPGDRIAVVGAGVVGLLSAALAAALPGAEVCVFDINADRVSLVESIGARFTSDARGLLPDCDVVIHASASSEGLDAALSCAGSEATVVEASWYGEGNVPVALGGAFHGRRLHLISSQVGQVSASRRPRWDCARRLGKAMDLLQDVRFDGLLEPDIPFAEVPLLLPAVLAKPGALAQVIAY
jgi:NADPH:quinone reductase-like Zn-dependent oxidoreductase